MFIPHFLVLYLIHLSNSIDPCRIIPKNVLKPLIEEINFKNILIVDSTIRNQVSLMKNLNKLNIYGSVQNWEEISASSSRQHVITVLSQEFPIGSFEKLLYFEKALVFLQDVEFENISTNIELEINQEVYFYDQKSKQLFETYTINNRKVKNILVTLNISAESSFIWEDGVTRG